MDSAGKKALVTGASRGIGRATALRLAQEGADMAVNYACNEESAREVAERIHAGAGRVLVLQADVGDRCDGFLLETDQSAWQRALDVHLIGTVWCSRLALPSMIEKRDGVIVNVSLT